VAIYNLSGAGDQALTAGTNRLLVDVTGFRANPERGDARPTNYFHLGLLRPGAGAYYAPVRPIDAASMFLDLAQGTNTLSYALFGGTTIRVTEQNIVVPSALQPWDRNSTVVVRSVGIAQAGGTAQATVWTYTVPAARKFMIGDAHVWLLKDGTAAVGAYAYGRITLNGNTICNATLSPFANNTYIWDELAGGTWWLGAGDTLACIAANPTAGVATYGEASMVGNEFDA
jgi:hypothetical protein